MEYQTSLNVSVGDMIRVPTVLVLGAGASAPFGYPVGGALTERIKAELGPDKPGQLYQDLTAAGFSSDELFRFRNQLRYSQRPSIDAFLEDWEADFMEVGKAAIAASLIRHEDRDKVVDNPNWYRRLFAEMTDEKDFSENKLSIVTFNYDRSLEYFFLRCLPARHHVPLTDAVNLLAQMQIIHLYGSLGGLPEMCESGRAYGESGTASILSAAKEIHLVRGSESPATFTEARNLMKEAKRIICLGFGFEKKNALRLGIGDFVESAEIFATLFKVCPVDERNIKAAPSETIPSREWSYESTFTADQSFEWFRGDALKFMETHGIEDPAM
jgi:hypothetical protein